VRHSNCRCRGFTLIEMIVVLGLVALLTTMAVRVTVTANDTLRFQEEQTLSMRTGWHQLHRLSRELRSAMDELDGKGWTGADGRTTVKDGLPKSEVPLTLPDAIAQEPLDDDSIRFPVALARDAKGNEGPGFVEIALKHDTNGRIVGLVRRERPTTSPEEDTLESEPRERVISFDVEYLDGKGKWRQVWKRGAPRAVRVKLATLANKPDRVFRIARFQTLVYLPTGTEIER